ncbi:MAG TPA: OB-fold domain-containing protein, partial [Solirubrobacteraceae bacterium]
MGPIGSLRGTLAERSPTGEVLVDVAGVGYRVQAGPLTAARLGDVGSEVFVWTHHHVREDAQLL